MNENTIEVRKQIREYREEQKTLYVSWTIL